MSGIYQHFLTRNRLLKEVINKLIEYKNTEQLQKELDLL